MLRPSRPFPRRVAARLLIWLLAALTPLQGMAAAVVVTLGPAHFHAKPTATFVLDDFRRVPSTRATPAAPTHVAGMAGHFHASDAPQRHRHARSDDSVVVSGADLASAASAPDESSPSPALAAFVALIPAALGWLSLDPVHGVASRTPWAPLTHEPDLPDRPPRRG